MPQAGRRPDGLLPAFFTPCPGGIGAGDSGEGGVSFLAEKGYLSATFLLTGPLSGS